jgi:predicted O-linked N-acetylglucosamine transferase (SPINDLY family)
MNITIGDAMHQAAALQGQGRLVEAERLYLAVVQASPHEMRALHMLGVIAAQRGALDDARQRLTHVLQLSPALAEAHSDLGLVLRLMGRPEEALASFARALALRPQFAGALANRAAVESELGRHQAALATSEQALAIDPTLAEAWNNRGTSLLELGNAEEALASFDRALQTRPAMAEAWHNRANALSSLSRPADAVASCDQALARAPAYVDAWNTRGVALHDLGCHQDALASFERALALAPRFAKALQNRGIALSFLRRHEEAARDLAQAVAIDPTLAFASGALLRSTMQLCDWSALSSQRERVVDSVRAGRRVIDPFTFLAVCEQPSDALACARTWASKLSRPASQLWRGERYAHERIRVAYLSSDFREHATAYLMAELFERHDRTRFEVSAVSWGAEEDTPMRRRLKAAFEHFEDVRGRSDRAAAQWLREREIDIAVDLKGYTYEARPGILSHRPCPVAVSYLGYPGTMGASYVDYLIADETVIPREHRQYYTEKVVYLPDCYQPNDRRRVIAEETPSRTALGLPERGFVFCSFNNSYKITPEVFDVWMRLLVSVQGSVLWLLEGNAAVPANLRREAVARGVAGERLVFAPRLPLTRHLARYRHADLFVDTLPYNAHTTASDALWAGVPVLTCLGPTFAGRVAASLVRAAGLPELVTHSLADYEALAVRLARDAALVDELRGRLSRNRDDCALFDAERTRRNLESAFVAMWENSRT